MRLHITLVGDSSRGPWSAAYIGEQASEARKALDVSPKPWALLINNPPAIRKRTPGAQADTVATSLDMAEPAAAGESGEPIADPVAAEARSVGRRGRR